MKRSGYIKRSKPPRQRRETKRRTSHAYSLDYMGEVAKLPCFARVRIFDHVCEGRIEVDHAGRRGMGQKCTSFETIPLCTKAHRERTDFSGAFKSFDRAQMTTFLEAGIEATQRALGYPERWT